MKKVVNKKDHRVVIIPKNTYRLNYKEPSLTLIRKVADVWNLKEEDIIEKIEFSSSYHIKIKAKLEYTYDYSGFEKYKHYSRDYYRSHPEMKENRKRRKKIKGEENESRKKQLHC